MERLTKKQKEFSDKYIETGNGTKAALEVYNTDDYNTAAAIASQNLNKLNIRAYLEEKSKDAASMVYKLSQKAKNEGVRLGASKDILDRAGFKPVEKSEVTLSLSLREMFNKTKIL